MIGKTLSHFRILAKIGEGGMGMVYKAEDLKLRRQVALKVLPPNMVGNEERCLRFLREARAAAAVSHPNIATVYDVGEADGVVYIAMELVEGETLRARLAGKPLSIKEALLTAVQVVEGLARAHQSHVVHRDLKPENIAIASDGQVKILDFGLAKLLEERPGAGGPDLSRLETISAEMTEAGKVLGTPAYMSPEQARGEIVEARSDIFSFGTMLYEMVTGRLPFNGRTNADILSAILRDEPVLASAVNRKVPAELQRIISGCLEKDPRDRYQHADQLAVDLRKLKRTTESDVQAIRTPRETVVAVRAWPSAWVRRRARWLVVAGLVAGLAAAAAAVHWRWTRPAPGLRSGDRVIVADFGNSTGRVEYDTTIRDAFEHMLSGSTFIEVVSGEELRNLVKDKTGVSIARIDIDLAHRLCVDGGCAGFFTGGTDPEGNALRIRVALHLGATDIPAITRVASAASEQQILEAIHRLVLGIRRDLGETPRAVSCTSPPTTRSLEAYQAYALGEGSDVKEALSLFGHAIDLDEGFVDAYQGLASSYGSLGDWHNTHKYAEEAYRRAAGLPEPARLLNEIQFLDASYDYDTEVERLKSYIRLCPFDFNAHESLAGIYFRVYEDPASAEKHDRMSLELQPERGDARDLCYSLAIQGKAPTSIA